MINLPSGAKLEITLAPFGVAHALHKAVLRELKALKVSDNDVIDVNLWKDLLCTLLSSDKVEECMWECLKRVLYDGQKVTRDTFESEQARGDFLTVCFEVGKANLLPFVKSLYAEYGHLLSKPKKGQA